MRLSICGSLGWIWSPGFPFPQLFELLFPPTLVEIDFSLFSTFVSSPLASRSSRCSLPPASCFIALLPILWAILPCSLPLVWISGGQIFVHLFSLCGTFAEVTALPHPLFIQNLTGIPRPGFLAHPGPVYFIRQSKSPSLSSAGQEQTRILSFFGGGVGGGGGLQRQGGGGLVAVGGGWLFGGVGGWGVRGRGVFWGERGGVGWGGNYPTPQKQNNQRTPTRRLIK